MTNDERRMTSHAVEPDRTPAPQVPPSPRPWGFWATIGWSALWVVLWILVATVAVAAFVAVTVIRNPNADIIAVAERAGSNGLILSVVMILQTPLLVGLVVLVASRRLPVRDYLGLKALRARETVVCILLLLALIGAHDTFTWLVSKEIVPSFMTEVYRTAGFLPLLWAALLVASPLAEETLFRGLLFKGIAASRLGVAGAVLISAAAWSLMHVQYNLYGIASIFAGGVFLGLVRWRTGSTTLTILLHAVTNTVATIETAVVVARLT
jgi:membrane protease YdiL (CAAX protease family)